jgi:hypothetical protein
VIVLAIPSPFGTTAVKDVPDTILTFAGFTPKSTVTPGANPPPDTLTVVPVGPAVGENDVTLGGP